MFMTCGSFWSTWIAMRWVLPSAARLGAAKASRSRMAVASRRNMMVLLSAYCRVIASEAEQSAIFVERPWNSQWRRWGDDRASRPDQYIPVFGQEQYLPDADLDRRRRRYDV